MGPTLTLGDPEGGGGAPHRLPQTSPAPPPAKVPASLPQCPPPAPGLRRFPCQPSNSTERVASLAPVGAPLNTSPPPSSASSPQNLGGRRPSSGSSRLSFSSTHFPFCPFPLGHRGRACQVPSLMRRRLGSARWLLAPESCAQTQVRVAVSASGPTFQVATQIQRQPR